MYIFYISSRQYLVFYNTMGTKLDSTNFTINYPNTLCEPITNIQIPISRVVIDVCGYNINV